MPPSPVVLDTNVFVAAGFNPRSASAKIVNAVKQGQLRMEWNDATRREIERILGQIPPLRKYAVAELFRAEDRFTGATYPEHFTIIPDPDDRKFAALAHAAGAILISNDEHLLRYRDSMDLTVLTPGAFWKRQQRTNKSSSVVILRDVREDDLAIFFEQQLDPQANYMAAFTARAPSDLEAFNAHWARILGDDSITIKTILFDGQVAGHIASFERFGQPEITYWIGREYWGKGIATRALTEFLEHVTVRPLYARAAKDNIASIRVLEKCGFTISGEDKGFSTARGGEVEEFILVLPPDAKRHQPRPAESR